MPITYFFSMKKLNQVVNFFAGVQLRQEGEGVNLHQFRSHHLFFLDTTLVVGISERASGVRVRAS